MGLSLFTSGTRSRLTSYSFLTVPPTLLPGHKNSEMVSVIELSPVVLKCPVQGEPTPLIIWFFGNESEENLHDSRGIKITGNELRIMQANVQDSGPYLCLAENSGGHVKYSFNVSVIRQCRKSFLCSIRSQ